jgi:hypothetical protein
VAKWEYAQHMHMLGSTTAVVAVAAVGTVRTAVTAVVATIVWSRRGPQCAGGGGAGRHARARRCTTPSWRLLEMGSRRRGRYDCRGKGCVLAAVMLERSRFTQRSVPRMFARNQPSDTAAESTFAVQGWPSSNPSSCRVHHLSVVLQRPPPSPARKLRVQPTRQLQVHHRRYPHPRLLLVRAFFLPPSSPLSRTSYLPPSFRPPSSLHPHGGGDCT